MPLTVTVDSPMTEADHVKAIHVFNEKNPQPHVIDASSARAPARRAVSTRIQLADTQKIVGDRRDERRHVLDGDRRVIVTIAACIEESTDGPRPHQRAGQGEARRGHRDQDADPAHPWRPAIASARRRRRHSARHHHIFACTYNGEEIFRADCRRRSPPTRSSPSIRSRPRAARSSSSWTGDKGFAQTESGADHGRMTVACSDIARARTGDRAAPALARRDSGRRPPLGLAPHGPADARDAGRRHRQSRHALGARRRGAVEPRRRRRGQVLRRLPRRRDAEHEGRRGALSGLRCRRAAGRSISSSASTSAAPSSSRRRRCRFESQELLALTAYVARQSRGLPIAAADRSAARALHRAGATLFKRRQGQLNLSCANCHDDNGARSSPATSSRRAIPPAIRSIGWSGRASARCSGGCATA